LKLSFLNRAFIDIYLYLTIWYIRFHIWLTTYIYIYLLPTDSKYYNFKTNIIFSNIFITLLCYCYFNTYSACVYVYTWKIDKAECNKLFQSTNNYRHKVAMNYTRILYTYYTYIYIAQTILNLVWYIKHY